MGAELHGGLHDAGGNGAANTGGHIVAAQLGDHAVLDVVDQRLVAVKDRGSVDGQVLDTHQSQFFHDHVQNEVTVAHVVVEGDGHAALDTCQLDGFLERMYDFIH